MARRALANEGTLKIILFEVELKEILAKEAIARRTSADGHLIRPCRGREKYRVKSGYLFKVKTRFQDACDKGKKSKPIVVVAAAFIYM
jgi:hypothetical protein